MWLNGKKAILLVLAVLALVLSPPAIAQDPAGVADGAELTPAAEDAVEEKVEEVVPEAVQGEAEDLLRNLMLALGGLMLACWVAAGVLGGVTGIDNRLIALVLGIVGAGVMHSMGVLGLPAGVGGYIAAGFFGLLAAASAGISTQVGKSPFTKSDAQ